LLFVLLALALALPFYARRKRYVLPPGPKGLPFVGNVRDLPRGFEWLAYAKWSRDVGQCIVCGPGRLLVILPLLKHRM
jgi:hypothetical protein